MSDGIGWSVLAVLVAVLVVLVLKRNFETTQPDPDGLTLNVAVPPPTDESRFDSYIAEMQAKFDVETFPGRIAGSAFRNDDGSVRRDLIARCMPFDSLTLRREPDCVFDRYAVQVLNARGQQLGYLPRETARTIAPQMDAGFTWFATVRSVGLAGESDNYGARIQLFGMSPNAVPELEPEDYDD